jgi:predicted dehydrogenase
MGGSHARQLRDGNIKRAVLAAVCDIDADKLKPYRNNDDVVCFEDSKDLIRSGKVDAVLIATPHYDHTTIGVDAFNNGLHVLVEKPISVHKADAEKLIAAYKKSKKRIFSAMFQQRTNPVFGKIRELVQGGELGELVRTNWIITNWFRPEAYYASGGWRATWKGEGGGVLLNQCPHNLDLFQWMCGMPSKVWAKCHPGKFHGIEVEDEVSAYFEYPNGATGMFVTSTGESPGTNRLEIAGDRGKLVLEGSLKYDRNVVLTSEFTRTSKSAFSRPESWSVSIPIPKGTTGHNVVTQNFVDAILDGKPLLAPAEEGIHSVELANAMIFSSWTGKEVDLPLSGQAYWRQLKKRIESSQGKKKKKVKKAATDGFDQSF